jgi:hypothetical protein
MQRLVPVIQGLSMGDSVPSRVTAKAAGGHTTNGMTPLSSSSNASIRLEYHWVPLGFTGSTKGYDFTPYCARSAMSSFQESVRVRGNIAIATVQRLSNCLEVREVVPVGLTTAIDVREALDLETGRKEMAAGYVDVGRRFSITGSETPDEITG